MSPGPSDERPPAPRPEGKGPPSGKQPPASNQPSKPKPRPTGKQPTGKQPTGKRPPPKSQAPAGGTLTHTPSSNSAAAREPTPEGGTLTHTPSSNSAAAARGTAPAGGTLTHAPSSNSAAAARGRASEGGTLTHTPSSDSDPPGSGQGVSGTLTHTPSSKAADDSEDSSDGLDWIQGAEGEPGIGTLTQLPTDAAGSASTTDEARWEIGQILAGIYSVESLLGEGGMGAVYRVRHMEWDVDLAVKTPLPRLFQDPVALQRFQREAETWIDLGLHPNVARCYYVREVEGSPRIFVEYVKGGTLKEWLATKRDPADWRGLLRLALELADGLAYAHSRGLVHRDVKPANCLLSERGTLRITDFGLVKVTGEVDLPGAGASTSTPATRSKASHAELTHFEAGMGTPEYAAPEQWASAAEVDARADVYSWGVLLWELVSGRRPFDAPDDRQPAGVLINRHCFSELPNPRDHRLDIPNALGDLLRRCLAKKPADRPATMREAREALAAFYLERCGEAAPPVPATPRVTATVLCNRALSLRDLGQHEAATATWEEALRLEPHHPESRFNLGLLRWRAGQLRDLELVEQLEAVRRVHTRAWIDELLLAQVHVERGDGEAALALLDEIPARAQSRPRVKATRAAAEARAGEGGAGGAPLPRFAAQTGELVGWNQRYILFLSDPVNRMGSRPGLTVFQRSGKRHAQLDLQGDEALGRTALAGPGASLLQGEFAIAGCLSGTLKVWDLRLKGPPRFRLRARGPIEVLAVGGANAVTGARVADGKGCAEAWDLLKGRPRGACEHAGPILALAVEGEEVWSADATTLKVWAIADGAQLCSWDLAGVTGIHPCAGGAILEFPEGAWLWEREHAQRGRRFSRRAEGRQVVEGVLAEVCADGVRLWNLAEGTCPRTVPHPAPLDAPDLRRNFQLELGESPSLTLARRPGEPLQTVLLGHISQPWLAPLALSRVESSEAALALQRTFQRHLGAARGALKRGEPRRALR
ncbi:MAG: protein kinase, partial [Planctomycetes bacterium]|nr:protein kinase [Planctomycetota bacterium]